ncbi:alpha/beta hydrolase [Actinospongicola halichondriae]|uniref:alpha/beta hydrolase n=1 Tax=Actinospongicola halichondriae TaxID=3236844 RepID=UPI003D3B0D2E
MAVDPQVQTILDMLATAEAPPLTEQTPDQVRASFAAMGALGAPEEIHEIVDSSVPGPAGDIPVRIYRPSDERPLPVLVWYHGGGFVIGDLDSHDAVCRSLANRSGCAVIAVDYRLAPEHPFPASPDDAVAAFDALRERASDLGIDPERMATGGDSAGGNLATIVANERRGAVAFQMLIYPVTDMNRTSQSYRDNAEGYLLSAELMAWFEGHYTGGNDLDDPRVSPLFTEDLTGVAPAFLLTAEFDPLRDEGEAYGKRLIDAGVPVSMQRYDGMIHGFIQMDAVIDAAGDAIDEAAAALKAGLS